MRHTAYLALRDLRALWRQPWFVAVTLVQPLIWLLLFGELFERMAALPGFGGESYIAYLAPGIVVMSALFSSGWNGMATIEDINRGVTDRLLVSPVRRGALIAGRVAQSAVVIVVQSVIMVLIALAVYAGPTAESEAALAPWRTLATPLRQRPLALGCDLVLHSTTKAINGHGDLFGGALLAREPALVERIHWWANAAGLCSGARDAWETLRGARTLALRIDRQEANAQAIAAWLEALQPEVIAATVAYLASSDASTMTGQLLTLGSGGVLRP
jgi:hypothetical protein